MPLKRPRRDLLAKLSLATIESLQNKVANAYPEIHTTRLSTLFTFIASGVMDQRVSVTYLGRGLKDLSKTTIKNDIKRADRLCGNNHLHNERTKYYSFMCKQLIGNQRNPIVLVDWSPIQGSQIFQVIREIGRAHV